MNKLKIYSFAICAFLAYACAVESISKSHKSGEESQNTYGFFYKYRESNQNDILYEGTMSSPSWLDLHMDQFVSGQQIRKINNQAVIGDYRWGELNNLPISVKIAYEGDGVF